MHITLNGQVRQLPCGTSLADLLSQMSLDSKQVATEVNYQLVPRGQHSEFVLSEGDIVEVVTLVGGG